MDKFNVEMNFCRRCGSKLEHKGGAAYVCQNSHTIFLSAPPAVGLVLLNDKNEILVLERAIDPGKGMLDVPGGFCDGPENLEDAVEREVREEIGLEPSDYTKPEFVLSGIDTYLYGGENLPVNGVMFTARMISDKQPVAADDAATAEWMPIGNIDFSKVHFAAVRAGLEAVVARHKS